MIKVLFFYNYIYFLLHFTFIEVKEKNSSKEMDITLLYTLLKYFKKQSPKNGWGNFPDNKAIDQADDIERIHLYRNYICHTDASEMETGLFNKSVLDLTEVIYDYVWFVGNVFKTRRPVQIFSILQSYFRYCLGNVYFSNT